MFSGPKNKSTDKKDDKNDKKNNDKQNKHHKKSTLNTLLKTGTTAMKATIGVASATVTVAKTAATVVNTAVTVGKTAATVVKTTVNTAATVVKTTTSVNTTTGGAASWFTSLGKTVLERLYESDVRPATTDSKGTLVEVFKGIYKQSPVANKDFRHSVYHQPNRNSITKTVKTVNRWTRGDAKHSAARQDHLILITSLVWALQDKASKNGDGFSRGSFKIVDPEGKLFDFLKGYVQFATGKEKVGFITSSNDFAYNRDPAHYLSSHYTKFETQQYGIDIRFLGAAPTLNILPNKGDSHLLFGRVKIQDNWYTILKAEQIGLGHPLEYLEHGKNFLFGNASHGVCRKESEIPKLIKGAYSKFHQNHNAGGKPASTISDMYQEISVASYLNAQATKAKERFMNALVQYRFTEDVLIRTGNEVIIDLTTYQPHKPLQLTQPKPQLHLPARTVSLPPTQEVFSLPVADPLPAKKPIPAQEPIPIAATMRKSPSSTVKNKVNAPRFKTNWKIHFFSGFAVAALGALYSFSFPTALSLLVGFTVGYFAIKVLQQFRCTSPLNALNEFKDLPETHSNVNIDSLVTNPFWVPAYKNATASCAKIDAQKPINQVLTTPRITLRK